MTRRRRHLTSEEQDLWHRVASTARPLEGRTFPHRPLPQKPGMTGEGSASGNGPARTVSSATESHLSPVREKHYTSAMKGRAHVASLDRKASRLLGRGRVRIDARIDLHGMTQDTAHRALQGFLHRARQNGTRYVLVITGKSGVLNRMVPLWLGEPALRAHVGAVTTAAARHGGEGALYIRLRRQS